MYDVKNNPPKSPEIEPHIGLPVKTPPANPDNRNATTREVIEAGITLQVTAEAITVAMTPIKKRRISM